MTVTRTLIDKFVVVRVRTHGADGLPYLGEVDVFDTEEEAKKRVEAINKNLHIDTNPDSDITFHVLHYQRYKTNWTQSIDISVQPGSLPVGNTLSS